MSDEKTPYQKMMGIESSGFQYSIYTRHYSPFTNKHPNLYHFHNAGTMFHVNKDTNDDDKNEEDST